VEESVCERVVLKPRNGRFRMPALAAEHVVPLKDLVENDSVHKPAETDAQQDSGTRGRVTASESLRGRRSERVPCVVAMAAEISWQGVAKPS
jgi:hypothetical protein